MKTPKKRALISVNSVVRFFDDQIRMYEELIEEEEKRCVFYNDLIEKYEIRKRAVLLIRVKFMELRGVKK